MTAFPDFFGNASVAHTLAQMIAQQRIPQTILLSGPEGVGKATLARRFAGALLGDPEKIERDDLSLAANGNILEDRDKWTSEKRAEDPLFYSSHPDFVTFAPDGPLRQITIQQIRLLRERAQLKPSRGKHRVFLIDRLDRANEQSANSLLKVLEEPPEHLVIIATAQNLYDLLPTIRSRSLVFPLSRLSDDEMQQFAAGSGMSDTAIRVALAEGCPGVAISTQLETFLERRNLLLTALECAAGLIPFSDWLKSSESFANRKSEKLELYLRPAYNLLGDLLRLIAGQTLATNRDVERRMRELAGHVTFCWVESAVKNVDELVQMVRRNIQKTAALDAFIVQLRESV